MGLFETPASSAIDTGRYLRLQLRCILLASIIMVIVAVGSWQCTPPDTRTCLSEPDEGQVGAPLQRDCPFVQEPEHRL